MIIADEADLPIWPGPVWRASPFLVIN